MSRTASAVDLPMESRANSKPPSSSTTALCQETEEIDYPKLVAAFHERRSGVEMISSSTSGKQRLGMKASATSMFTGKSAAKWFVTRKHARDISSAVLLGNVLIRRGFVKHVTPGKKLFDCSSSSLYQFIEEKIHMEMNGNRIAADARTSAGDEDDKTSETMDNGDTTKISTSGHDDDNTCATDGSIDTLRSQTRASTSEKLLGESVADLLSVESETKYNLDASNNDGDVKQGEESVKGRRPRLIFRVIDGIITTVVDALGWPFALHVVSAVGAGLSCAALTTNPARNFVLVSPLIMTWLYAVERHVRRRYVLRLQNSIWKSVSVGHAKTFESEHAAWFNRVLSSLWVGWLVPYLNRLVKRLVNPLLDDVKPSFFSTLAIDEFNLGKRGPYIKSLRCYDGSHTEDMVMEWDLDLCTKDMKIILAATLGGKHLGMPIKVFVTDLRIVGPLRLGFKWMPTAPHLKHMTISFLSVPDAKVCVKPISNGALDLTELPGLQGWVDKLVRDGLQQAMVEPNSIFWDVEDMWRGVEAETDLVYNIFEQWKTLYGDPTPTEADTTATETTPAQDAHEKVLASVDVVVCSGSNLEVQSFDLKITTYCVVRHGARGKYRTASHDGVSPTWQEHCFFDIYDWSTDDSSLVFEIYDRTRQQQSMLQRAIVLNSDSLIGRATVDLRALAKDDGKIHSMRLALENVSTGALNVKICVSISEGCKAPVVALPSSASSSAHTAASQQQQRQADVPDSHPVNSPAEPSAAKTPSTTASDAPTPGPKSPSLSFDKMPSAVEVHQRASVEKMSSPPQRQPVNATNSTTTMMQKASIPPATQTTTMEMGATSQPASPSMLPDVHQSLPLPSSLHTSCVVSGFVFKRFHKDKGFKNWKRRFATVDVSPTSPKNHAILRYYKSRQSDTPRGELTLVAGLHATLRVTAEEMTASTTIKMPAPCPNGHLIVIVETNGNAAGSLFLCFDSVHDCARWQTAFEAVLPGSGTPSARSLSFLGGGGGSVDREELFGATGAGRSRSAASTSNMASFASPLRQQQHTDGWRESVDKDVASGRSRSNASSSTART